MSTPPSSIAPHLTEELLAGNKGLRARSDSESKSQTRKLPNRPGQVAQGSVHTNSLQGQPILPPIETKNSHSSVPTNDTTRQGDNKKLSSSYSAASTAFHGESMGDDKVPTAANVSASPFIQEQVVSTQPGSSNLAGATSAPDDINQLCEKMQTGCNLEDAPQKRMTDTEHAPSSNSSVSGNVKGSTKTQDSDFPLPGTDIAGIPPASCGELYTNAKKVQAVEKTTQQQRFQANAEVEVCGEIKLVFEADLGENSFHNVKDFPGTISERKWRLLESSGRLRRYKEFQDGVTVQTIPKEKLVTVSKSSKIREDEFARWVTECVKKINTCLLEIETANIIGHGLARVAQAIQNESSGHLVSCHMSEEKGYLEVYAIDSLKMDEIFALMEPVLSNLSSVHLLLKVPVKLSDFEMLRCLGFRDYFVGLIPGNQLQMYYDPREPSIVLESLVDKRRMLREEIRNFLGKQANVSLDVDTVAKCLLFDARAHLLKKLLDNGLRGWWLETDGQVKVLASSPDVAHKVSKFLKTYLMSYYYPYNPWLNHILNHLKKTAQHGSFTSALTKDGQSIQIVVVGDACKWLLDQISLHATSSGRFAVSHSSEIREERQMEGTGNQPGQREGMQMSGTGCQQGQKEGMQPSGTGCQPGQREGMQPSGTGYQPGQRDGMQPSGTGYQPGQREGMQPSGTGYQPGQRDGRQPSGTSYQPGQRDGMQPSGTGYQPGQRDGMQPSGTGYQPGQREGMQPSGTGYQPGQRDGMQPSGTGYQPGQRDGRQPSGTSYQPGQRDGMQPSGTGCQPGQRDGMQPSGTGYQPGQRDGRQPSGTSYQPGQRDGMQPSGTGYQPGQRDGMQPSGTGYQPGQRDGRQPSGTSYQPGQRDGMQPSGTGYQPGQRDGMQPSGTGYQPGQRDGMQPSGTGYQPGQRDGMQPSGTGYQPGQREGMQPSGTGYQPGQRDEMQPSGTGYQPGQREVNDKNRDSVQSAPLGVVLRQDTNQPGSIQVDDLVNELLQFETNRLKLKGEVHDRQCFVKFAPEGFIEFSAGSPTQGMAAIEKLFYMERFESDIDDPEFEQALKTFKVDHTESLTYCNRSGFWFICFTSDAAKPVSELLEVWKHPERSVPLPLYAHDFAALKLGNIRQQLKVQVHQSVKIDLSTEAEPKCVLSADRGNMSKAVDWLQNLVLSIETAEKKIEVHHAVGLQGVKNQKCIQQMETEYDCRVDIQQKGKPTMSWTSPQGLMILVCENSIATTDCDIMVLPLGDEQPDWPPLHKYLLRKSFLSTDIQTYHEAVKEAPLLLQCHGNFAGQRIAIVPVPAKWESGQKQEKARIMKVYQQVFSACKGEQQSLAVIAQQSPQMDLVKPLKVILQTIFELESGSESRTVVIHTDSPQQTQEVCDIVKKGLRQGWTNRPLRVPRPALRKRMIQTEIGEIQKTVADVVVNSTGKDLKVDRGAVEKAILDAAGDGLIKECEKTYPNGIPPCGLAITNAFNMKNTKKIYHVALSRDPFPADNQKESAVLLHDLSSVMYRCLLQASWENYTSIAFPTLGSGKLAYPCGVVAQTMFSTINNFFREMPHSSLKKVIIVIFSRNREAIQVFKKEEISHLYTFATDKGKLEDRHGLSMQLGKHIIQGVHGNADQKPCVAEVCIRGELASEKSPNTGQNSRTYDDQGCETIVLKAFTKAEYKDSLQKALAHKGVSVQILAHTLRFHLFSMEELAKQLEDLLMHKKDLKLVSVIFSDEEKVGCFSGSFKAVEGGCVEISENESKHGDVFVCAPKLGTIMEKIQSLPLLPRLTHAAFLQELKGQRQREEDDVDSRREAQNIELRGDLVSGRHPSQADLVSILNGFLSDLRKKNTFTEENICQALMVVREGIGSKPSTEQKTVAKEKEEQSERGSALDRELDELAVVALKFLMKDEFDQAFDVQENNGRCSVKLKGASSHDVMSKVDSLRREDVPLSESEMMKIGEVVDVRKEGIEAFVKAVRDQGKAAIFAFDYNAITKAKHLLAVKAGRVKVTARARRRFDQASSGQENRGDQSPPQSLDSSSLQSGSGAGTADFFTQSGIKVSVYKTDITKLPVDAIVNAANENLAHGGGVACAISRAAGYSLDDEGQEHIRKHGPLKVSEVAVTTGGYLPCKMVLHAVGPRWYDYSEKKVCQQLLIDTVYNCFAEADTLGFVTLALPSISSAIFGVPQEICAECYLAAVKKFAEQRGNSTSLKHIHFVDVSDAMVTMVQKTFRDQWESVRAQHVHPVAQDEARNGERGNTPGRANWGEVVPTPAKQPASFDGNVAQVPIPPPRSRGKSNSEPPGSPYLKVIEENNSAQSQVHFKDLNFVMVFQTAAVSDIKTEAIVFWRDTQNKKDPTFKQYEKKMNAQTKKQINDSRSPVMKEGTVHSVQTSAQLLVFAVSWTDTSDEKDQFKSLTEQALSVVNKAGKKSVAIPRFAKKTTKGKKDNNKDVETFVTGLYRAVRNYSKQRQRAITEVHVLDHDPNTLKLMIDTVSDLIAIERSVEDQKSTPATAEAGSVNLPDSCAICKEEPIEPKTLSCNHVFCTACIDKWFKHKQTCPVCNKIHGTLYGHQPKEGTMKIFYSHTERLADFQMGAYVIEYFFPPGQQTENHPQPGKAYSDTRRQAFLPDTEEGRTVLMLLKTAFDRRLVFTIGTSSTTGKTGIVWNDIHHKTSKSGGQEKYGYPDANYFVRVQQELNEKGVTKEDLTLVQKDFILHPFMYRKPYDFSNKFTVLETSV